MEKTMLEKTFQFYLDNLVQLENQYKGKFIALKDCKVLGAYDTFDIAYSETAKTEEVGTFLIQQASTDKSAYTIVYANQHILI